MKPGGKTLRALFVLCAGDSPYSHCTRLINPSSTADLTSSFLPCTSSFSVKSSLNKSTGQQQKVVPKLLRFFLFIKRCAADHPTQSGKLNNADKCERCFSWRDILSQFSLLNAGRDNRRHDFNIIPDVEGNGFGQFPVAELDVLGIDEPGNSRLLANQSHVGEKDGFQLFQLFSTSRCNFRGLTHNRSPDVIRDGIIDIIFPAKMPVKVGFAHLCRFSDGSNGECLHSIFADNFNRRPDDFLFTHACFYLWSHPLPHIQPLLFLLDVGWAKKDTHSVQNNLFNFYPKTPDEKLMVLIRKRAIFSSGKLIQGLRGGVYRSATQAIRTLERIGRRHRVIIRC